LRARLAAGRPGLPLGVLALLAAPRFFGGALRALGLGPSVARFLGAAFFLETGLFVSVLDPTPRFGDLLFATPRFGGSLFAAPRFGDLLFAAPRFGAFRSFVLASSRAARFLSRPSLFACRFSARAPLNVRRFGVPSS